MATTITTIRTTDTEDKDLGLQTKEQTMLLKTSPCLAAWVWVEATLGMNHSGTCSNLLAALLSQ